MAGFTKAGTGARIEDSNIALLGSKLEKDVKLAAAKSEKAWKGAGEKEGIQIWRIEKFEVKEWPKEKYGTFYAGDAFIVLHSYKRPGSHKMSYNIHFWLGKDCTQDEWGTAAYKTVELDDYLGGVPVQFRELQGSESSVFRKLFPSVKVLEGGIDSGFTHVEAKKYKARLLHIHAENMVGSTVWVTELPLALSSLDPDDVYLVDAGLTLWQWNGPGANVTEKIKGRKMVEAFREERSVGEGASWRYEIVEGYEDNVEFWQHFGLKKTPQDLAQGKTAANDLAQGKTADKDKPHENMLFRISDESGSLKFTLVKKGELSVEDLDMKDAFLIDVGWQLYVWIGRNASKQERSKGMMFAIAYLERTKRPPSTPIVRVLEGHETAAFKDCLTDSMFYGEKKADEAVQSARSRRGSVVGPAAPAKSVLTGKALLAHQLPGVLKVTVHSAKDLRTTQMLGKQDPFAVIKLGSQKHRTKVHEDGDKEASWEQIFHFELKGNEDVVFVQVRNANILIDSTIGTTAPIDLKSISKQPYVKREVSLLHKESAAGTVILSLSYHPARAFRITRAKNLPTGSGLLGTTSSPYVRVTCGHGDSLLSPSGLLHATGNLLLDPLNHGSEKSPALPMARVNFTTAVCKGGGADPGWKSDNVFELNLEMLEGAEEKKQEEELLAIAVYRKSLLPTAAMDSLLGRVEIPLSKLYKASKGREINFSLSKDGGKTTQGQIFIESL